jgi:hypothetical protein
LWYAFLISDLVEDLEIPKIATRGSVLVYWLYVDVLTIEINLLGCALAVHD